MMVILRLIYIVLVHGTMLYQLQRVRSVEWQKRILCAANQKGSGCGQSPKGTEENYVKC
jgi:hypothetical protein